MKVQTSNEMMNNDTSNEIRLTEVADMLRQHKRVLFGFPLIFLILAVCYLHFAENKYSVVLKVTPTISVTPTVPAGIGNLASLAGISIPGGLESIAFDLYLEGIKSRETSAVIATNQTLMQHIFPAEWDEDAGEWTKPSGIMPALLRLIKAVLGASDGPWQPPDAGRVNEFLDEEVNIVRDRNSPVVTILMQHSQPEVAQSLLGALHDSVDSALRKKELDRTTSYVEYLKERMTNVSVTEYRQALYEVIVEQEKRRMVASSDLPFAAEPFGKPTASPQPIKPRPTFVLILSLFLGSLVGVLGAFVANQLGNSGRVEL